MAKHAGVWGIDIGQAAFKALRCQMDGDQVVADAFDYIEYPKILSQPEAEPEKMIHDAIEQFLSRNDVKGCDVALAVPGQSGLAKFFKPPPVDAKKIPEIVKYEARQQIPFALDDVIWDFQQMGGEDGFAAETEVGLFAMKREQVYRAMKPFDAVGVELDIIQLAPLSIYNFVTHDILGEQLASGEFDPDNPPPSLVVLSMGTDTTDLVITNGFRVWQRSVPLGGNHFTKQLTKELKLTFAKAEHLKRNARQAEDPKLVFQAMRPVFNDLVTEVQRSIGYFQGIDRKAKINGVVVLGNAVKLPGLQQYLAKNLGYEVNNFETFSHLGGQSVVSSPAFRDNQLSFGVCYGLCLQGLGKSRLRTNLVPREIMNDRLVRAKKPWAVASLAALLLACTFNVFFYYSRLHKSDEQTAHAGVKWVEAINKMNTVQTQSNNLVQDDTKLVAKLDTITAIGEELVGNADRQILWMEMLRAVNSTLPVTKGLRPGEIPDVNEVPFDKREEIHVESLEDQYYDDLKTWFTEDIIKKKYLQQIRDQNELLNPDGTEKTITGPTDAGWVLEMKCYHFFNSDRQSEGIVHVLETIVRRLKENRIAFPAPVSKLQVGNLVRHAVGPGQVRLMRVTAIVPDIQPDPNGGPGQLAGYQLQLLDEQDGTTATAQVGPTDDVPVSFTMKEMGIEYPVVVNDPPINRNFTLPNPNFEPPAPGTRGSGMGGGMAPGGMGAPGGMSSGAGAPPGGGMGAGGFGAGRSSGRTGTGTGTSGTGTSGTEGDEKIEPPRLVVPRYDFTLQFVWKETPLSTRLQTQAETWQTEQQNAPQPATTAGIASNNPGGA